MSLYNQLFGLNPLAGIVLRVLEVEYLSVPRIRDAWYDSDADRLAIYTRTGGPNRASFAEGNDYLRGVAGFESDADDPYDNTYATWLYLIPEETRPVFDKAKEAGYGAEPKPHEKWQTLFADQQAGAVTEATERAAEVGKRIIDQMVDNGRPGVKIIET